MQKDRQYQKLLFSVKIQNASSDLTKRILNEFVHGSTILHMVYFKKNQAWRSMWIKCLLKCKKYVLVIKSAKSNGYFKMSNKLNYYFMDIVYATCCQLKYSKNL